MKMRCWKAAAIFFFFLTAFFLRAEVAQGEHGMVVTVNPIATQAGINAMQHGGNAIDAAVASALTLGVVDGHNSGIGGGCFMLIRRANGSYLAIDGREMAPAKAARDMFLRDGKPDANLSQLGALAIATPGALAAYDSALKRWGKIPLKEHLLAAAKIAEDGFKVDKHYAEVLKDSADDLKKVESTRAIFLKSDGKIFRENEIIAQPDLAKTYRAIATNGIS
ncbi:MAG: gamma-glutamyltransferase, partial [Limisphaerales bacterium]